MDILAIAYMIFEVSRFGIFDTRISIMLEKSGLAGPRIWKPDAQI